LVRRGPGDTARTTYANHANAGGTWPPVTA